MVHWLWLVVDCRESLGNPGGGSTWDKDGWRVGAVYFGDGRVRSGIHLLGVTEGGTNIKGDQIMGDTLFFPRKSQVFAFTYSVYSTLFTCKSNNENLMMTITILHNLH